LGDVALQVLRIEVVTVQMRDEKIVSLADRIPVQLRVVRERKPGAEVGRIHPRIGQNGAVCRLDQHTRVARPGDLHPSTVSIRGPSMTPRVRGARMVPWP